MKKTFTLLTSLLALFIQQTCFAQGTQNVTWTSLGGTLSSGTISGSTSVTLGSPGNLLPTTVSYSISGNYQNFNNVTNTSNSNDNIGRLNVDWANTTSSVTLVISFSRPVNIANLPINNVSFDNSGAGRHNDQLLISARNGGNTTNGFLQYGTGADFTVLNSPSSVYTDLTCSPSTFVQNSAGSASVTAVGDNGTTGGSDDIDVITNTTQSGITQLTIVFSSGTLNGGVTNPEQQVIDFGTFRITSSNASSAPLPVTFANVSTKLINEQVLVSWSNLTENDVNYYEVERSADGKNFAVIGRVAAKGNDFSRYDYDYTDNAPGQLNYYRIKALDYDGESKSTAILRISKSKGKAGFSIYPNPVQNKTITLQAQSIGAGNYTLQLYNNGGQMVFSKNLALQDGSVSQSIELPAQLRPGIYMMKINGNEVRHSATLFIQ